MRIYLGWIALAIALGACNKGTDAKSTTPTHAAIKKLSPHTLPPEVSQMPKKTPTLVKQKSQTRSATQREQRIIDQLASNAESVRGLRFVNAVHVEVENKTAITESLLGQLKEEDLQRAKTIYTVLGLLPPDVDLERLLIDVLGEQVVGYYDPETHRLVVRDDVMVGLQGASEKDEVEETKVVLIHELVHALQDQKLSLGKAHKRKRDSDAENAFRAVIEGDATLAMMAHALRSQGMPLSLLTRNLPQFGSMMQGDSLLSGQNLNKAPAILRVTLVAPYLRGLELAAAMHAQGEWKAVNHLHKNLPSSSEQFLHPQKYIADERPDRIRLPKFASMRRASFKVVQEDTLGELEMGVYLGQGIKGDYDTAASEGWGGDRLRVYSRGDEAAAVWFTSWDSVADAEEAATAAKRVSVGVQNALVKRIGRAVLILRNVAPLLQPEIIRAFKRMQDGLVTRPKSEY